MPSKHSPKLTLTIWLTMFASVVCTRGAKAEEADVAARTYIAATVLGEKVFLRRSSPQEVAKSGKKLSVKKLAEQQAAAIWRPLVSKVSHRVMSDWATQNKVSPTEAEIAKLFQAEAKQHLAMYTTEKQQQQINVGLFWGIGSATEWVRAKALHEKYGGRIALSSFGGWISIEGRNALLKEYAAAGKIEFHDPAIEKLFWQGVQNPAVLDVTVSDQERIAQHFARPPWQTWRFRMAEHLKKTSVGTQDDDETLVQPIDQPTASTDVDKSDESEGN